LIAKAYWEDVDMDVMLGLPRSPRNKDSVVVVVDPFYKMTHFVPCSKTLNAINIADLYFKKIVILCRIPKNNNFGSRFQVYESFLAYILEETWNSSSIQNNLSSTN
jgi:hypothetical protein